MAKKQQLKMKTKIKRGAKIGGIAILSVAAARYAVRFAASKGVSVPGAALIG